MASYWSHIVFEQSMKPPCWARALQEPDWANVKQCNEKSSLTPGQLTMREFDKGHCQANVQRCGKQHFSQCLSGIKNQPRGWFLPDSPIQRVLQRKCLLCRQMEKECKANPCCWNLLENLFKNLTHPQIILRDPVHHPQHEECRVISMKGPQF